MSDVTLFTVAALEKIAQVIGDNYTGTQITALFQKAGYSEYVHDGTTKWRWTFTALLDLQDKNKSRNHILKMILQACSPEENVFEKERLFNITNAFNQILHYYGLKISDDYKNFTKFKVEDNVITANKENLRYFNERTFHAEIVKHSRDLFIEGNFFHSVFESCKAFDKFVKIKAQIDESGTSLMTKALSLKGPLKLNSQQTETERNEQDGIMHLCMGLMAAIRNPESHEPKLDWKITRQDALDILSLISFLFRQVEKATYFKS